MAVRRKPQKADPVGHGAKSAAVRERAILALLSERTLESAAKAASVSERTLRRWLADDEAFQAEYSAARTATYQAGMSRIQALVGKAVNTLEDLLASDTASVQLGAARAITDLGVHQHDAAEILRKLDEIESRQQGARR